MWAIVSGGPWLASLRHGAGPIKRSGPIKLGYLGALAARLWRWRI